MSEYLPRVAKGRSRHVPRRKTPVKARPASYGLCLSGLDRYNEVDKALLEAHQMLDIRFSAQHERTIKAINALADLYDA